MLELYRSLFRRPVTRKATAPIRRTRLGCEALDVRAVPAVITQWDFNSPTPDGSYATGTTAPAVGAGTLTTLGGTNTSYNLGSINNGSSDPSGDNTGLNIVRFPSQGQADRTAGLAVAVGTAGYDDIVLSFDQRNSNTASGTEVVQVSTDGGASWSEVATLGMSAGEA